MRTCPIGRPSLVVQHFAHIVLAVPGLPPAALGSRWLTGHPPPSQEASSVKKIEAILSTLIAIKQYCFTPINKYQNEISSS